MWGGNPCVFIKDLNVGETWSNYTMSYVNHFLADAHKNEFTVWNAAYLDRASTQDDLDNSDLTTGMVSSPNLMHGMVKYYC